MDNLSFTETLLGIEVDEEELVIEENVWCDHGMETKKLFKVVFSSI